MMQRNVPANRCRQGKRRGMKVKCSKAAVCDWEECHHKQSHSRIEMPIARNNRIENIMCTSRNYCSYMDTHVWCRRIAR